MLGGFGAKKDVASSRRVSGWVRAATDSSKVTNVMATEIQCNEPDCVPIETLIVVIGTAAATAVAASAESTSSCSNNRWVGKVLKPLAQCTQEDISELDFLEFAAVRGADTQASAGASAETSTASAVPIEVDGAASESATDMGVEVEAPEAAPECIGAAVGHKDEDGQWMDDMLQSLRDRMTPLAREGRMEIMSHFERLFSELRRSASASRGGSSSGTGRAGIGAGTGAGAVVRATTTQSSTAPRTTPAVTVVPMVFASAATATATATATPAASASATGTAVPAYSTARRRPPPTRSFIAQTQRPPAAVKARAGADKAGLAGGGSSSSNDDGPSARHKKGVRPRGCPCCDPDAMDNIVDKLLLDSNL